MSPKGKRAKYDLDLVICEEGEAAPRGREVVKVGQGISFDPGILTSYCSKGSDSIHYDMLTLAATVEYADRRQARRLNRCPRNFRATIPVSKPHIWQQPRVQELLHDALRHLTSDKWNFKFVESRSAPICGQDQLQLPDIERLKYVIPYSDGLDSRCVSGLYPGCEIERVRVEGTRNRVCPGKEPFNLIPFQVKLARSAEYSLRSRGFKFAVIAAIASHLAGLSTIIVPESGQGALGPVILPLHNIYPDYRNHPVFFRKMEMFIKALLEHSVRYEQPRLWSTKGQTVQAYLGKLGSDIEDLVNTRSCWQKRWNVQVDGKRRQCGLCVACLLRRMSMRAAKVIEPEVAYAFTHLDQECYEKALPHGCGIDPTRSMLEYGITGVQHLQQFADLARPPNDHLKSHALEIALSTGESEEETLGKLTKLAANHASEWHTFVESLGTKSFIKRWATGEHHD